ncbi:MAG: hypothetical protein LBU65_13245 [Planctomycetaceae bacterium]|jgi:ribosome biogenesis GTPase A|nr:hypothetical protein [Planctomycetaceae bacterium]
MSDSLTRLMKIEERHQDLLNKLDVLDQQVSDALKEWDANRANATAAGIETVENSNVLSV